MCWGSGGGYSTCVREVWDERPSVGKIILMRFGVSRKGVIHHMNLSLKTKGNKHPFSQS